MPNRLNLPEELENLIEKREKDRRQEETSDAKQSQSETPPAIDRRHGPGRRAEDRE